MSTAHLVEIRSQLEACGWEIAAEDGGDGRSVSAIWQVVDRSGKRTRHIVFEGMDERAVLPIENAYGCHVQEAPKVSLYFFRIHGRWKDAVKPFIDAFNRLETA
jgi:hypothetical protein